MAFGSSDRAAPGRAPQRSRSSSRAGSASARPRWSARSARSTPLRTEELLSAIGDRRRRPAPAWSARRTTTVALDFGRITINSELIALPVRHARARSASGSCGTSWPTGALGAVVLADTRRLDALLPGGRLLRAPRDPVRGRGQLLRRRASATPRTRSRAAADLDPLVPVILCDVRQRESCKAVLITLLKYLIRLSTRNGGVRHEEPVAVSCPAVRPVLVLRGVLRVQPGQQVLREPPRSRCIVSRSPTSRATSREPTPGAARPSARPAPGCPAPRSRRSCGPAPSRAGPRPHRLRLTAGRAQLGGGRLLAFPQRGRQTSLAFWSSAVARMIRFCSISCRCTSASARARSSSSVASLAAADRVSWASASAIRRMRSAR